MPSSRNRELKAREYLEERFGIKFEETDYELKERSGDIWLVSEQVKQMKDDLKPETYGVRAVRFMKIGLKPTTYALQLLQNQLEKNTVELEKENLMPLLAREKLVPCEAESKGYVAIQHDGHVIGCGFYKDDVVSSRVPKGRSNELRELL